MINIISLNSPPSPETRIVHMISLEAASRRPAQLATTFPANGATRPANSACSRVSLLRTNSLVRKGRRPSRLATHSRPSWPKRDIVLSPKRSKRLTRATLMPKKIFQTSTKCWSVRVLNVRHRQLSRERHSTRQRCLQAYHLDTSCAMIDRS
jgi:hypothetical protein